MVKIKTRPHSKSRVLPQLTRSQMKHTLLAVVTGCFIALTANAEVLIQTRLTGDTGTIRTSLRDEFDLFAKKMETTAPAGAAASPSPTTFLRAAIEGSTEKIQETGNLPWGATPQSLLLSFDATTRILSLEGSEMPSIEVPVRDGFIFNGITITLVIGRGTFNPSGTMTMDIPRVNNQVVNTHLAASKVPVAGEIEAITYYWDGRLPQQSVEIPMTVYSATGYGANRTFTVVPSWVQVVPEPGTASLLLAGFGILFGRRPKKRNA